MNQPKSNFAGCLGISIAIAVAIHVLGFVSIHNHVFHPRLAPAHTVLFLSDLTYKGVREERETALLKHVFDDLMEMSDEVKEELHDLVAEFTPSPLLVFPTPEPTLEEKAPPSVEVEVIHSKPHENLHLLGQTVGPCTVTIDPIESALPMMEELGETEEYLGQGVIASSEHFDVHVEYTPKQGKPGYVFKATFYPKVDMIFKRIPQNYYFLIDRSNSIPRGRFLVNKRLVAEALGLLKPRDTFNILLFDDGVTKLADNNLPWNEENVARAREFLKNEPHGGYFAATDLYSSLGKVIPNQVSDHEMHTAILLSDGDSYLPADKQRQTIGGWTKQNRGRVALFSVATGSGNNLPLLDLISSFNLGALVYAMKHTEVAERLIELIKTIRNPIGKGLTVTAVTTDKQMVVLLQPKQGRLPCLYKDRPFTIYGSTNRLGDFVLFLQGHFYDCHFDIKKRIQFSQARLGTVSIERAWTQLLVQELYERYFTDGNVKHLEEAKKLLLPLQLTVPFIPTSP